MKKIVKDIFYKKYKGCQRCGLRIKSYLLLHHVSYENYENEKINDLRLLCIDCHNLFHSYVKGSDPDLKRLTDIFIKNI